MELKSHVVLLTFVISLIITKQASCVRLNILFAGEPSLSPSSTPSHIEPSLIYLSLPPSKSMYPSSSPSTTPPLPEAITSLFTDLEKTISNVPKKVEEACKKTSFPTECSASMSHVLDGKLDPLSIFNGEAKAFDHALEVAKVEISSLSRVVNDKVVLSTCEEMYENAREEVNKAIELADTGNDKYGANIRLSAALTFVETCEDELSQDMEGDSPLARINKLLSKLASNSLALGNFAMGNDDEEI